uniref:Uncharacterized protein LOC111123632 n=1 Tax=Crassostrea virginica TaxID=6565 RepID=A0A8B8D153_CRAVI|nr:uncharacterized protein LOC111123632 [Crassostrea virginica]
MKNVPESTGNSQKTTEVNASYQEEVRFQMTSTGEEKKQSSSKNSIVMLIIVAVFSMAVGAAGGILVYRETLGTVPTPQTEAPVVEGQNQERLEGSSVSTTMSSNMADMFYDELEKNNQGEEDEKSIHQTGVLPVMDSQIVDYRYLACGFDGNICAWSSADYWEVTTETGGSRPHDGYLLYNSSSSYYNEAVLTSRQVNNSQNAFCLLIVFRADTKATLSVLFVHGATFDQLWEEPIQDDSWQFLRLNISTTSELFQVFIVAKDLQRTGVQVKLNYTDLRPEVCKSSMTVEAVPDVLKSGNTPPSTEASIVNHGGGLLDGVFLPPESEQTTGAGMSGGSFLGPSSWGFGGLPRPVEDTAAEEPPFYVGDQDASEDVAFHSFRNRLAPSRVEFSQISCDFETECEWFVKNNWIIKNETIAEVSKSEINPKGSYAYTFASTSGNSLASLYTNIIHLYNASSVFCLSFKFYKPYHGLFGVYHSDTELMEMTRLWSERNSSTYWRMGKLNITSASDFIIVFEADEMKDGALVALDDIILTNTTCSDTPTSQHDHAGTTPAPASFFDKALI